MSYLSKLKLIKNPYYRKYAKRSFSLILLIVGWLYVEGQLSACGTQAYKGRANRSDLFKGF